MNKSASAQSEVDVLTEKYRKYIGKLKAEWLSGNRVASRDVYEVMRPNERAEVHQRIAAWGEYITPFAETWWKERGYTIVWPADNSKPVQLCKSAAA